MKVSIKKKKENTRKDLQPCFSVYDSYFRNLWDDWTHFRNTQEVQEFSKLTSTYLSTHLFLEMSKKVQVTLKNLFCQTFFPLTHLYLVFCFQDSSRVARLYLTAYHFLPYPKYFSKHN